VTDLKPIVLYHPDRDERIYPVLRPGQSPIDLLMEKKPFVPWEWLPRWVQIARERD
jgi:hypothetical protein